MHYLPSQNLYITDRFTYTPEELAVIDRLEKEYNDSHEELRFTQLFEIFSDNKKEIAVILAENLNELRTQRKDLLETLARCTIAISKIYRHRWFSEMMADIWVKQEIIALDKKIKRLIFQIDSLAPFTDTREDGQLTTQQIAQAKAVPLTNFLSVNRARFARCPFHKDRTASLKVYMNQNTFFCFSCNEGGDVIHLIQQIKKCTFREAVFFLIG